MRHFLKENPEVWVAVFGFLWIICGFVVMVLE